MDDFVGVGGRRFCNGALGSDNDDYSIVAEFLVLVFLVSRSVSTSAGDGAATVENVGGVVITVEVEVLSLQQ